MTDEDILRRMIAYAAEPTPRYTSYPTANRFEPGLGEDVLRAWLGGINSRAPLSLYVHIPFCAQQCWYCGCNMKLSVRYAPIGAYVEALCAEIDLIADASPAGLSFAHLHFGGGTPSVLEAADLARIMARLRARFAQAPGSEIALEIDPRTVKSDFITALGELGFNRASLGVQDFDPRVQKAINREQSPALIAEVSASLRAVGVKSLNFDLLYGLPHQTSAGLAQTIAQSLSIAPDRIALFGYAHVPWFAKNQRMIAEDVLPGAAERAQQILTARRALQAAGYDAIGIDHFALPQDDLARAAKAGLLHRNFQGYTTDGAGVMLGFGATAIGQTPQGFFQTIAETGAYTRAISAGRLPVERGLGVTAEDRLRAAVIEDLMCVGATDLAARAADAGFPVAVFDAALARAAPLIGDGLAAWDGSVLRLSEAGMLLARLTAACFDAYRVPAAGRHAVSV
jgi:oxygen-independent coproporphyrinogen III oxidase